MPIRINAVTTTPNRTTVGQPVVFVISAEDIVWNNLKTEFTDWGEIYRSFNNWNKVKNYIYTKGEHTPDADCIYASDGYALFDKNAVQVSCYGGGTSRYSSSTINQFIGEVLYGE